MAMAVSVAVLAFVGGAAVSVSATWLLIFRVERVAEWLGLSEAMLGLLAALAADPANIAAAIAGLASHQRALGAGVVIGSNIFNLAALIGLGAVVAGRIELHRKVVALSGAVGLWVALACFATVAGLFDSAVGLGLVLVALVPYVVLLGMHRAALRHLSLPRGWTDWLTSAVSEEEQELELALRPQRGSPRDVAVAVPVLFLVILATVTMERGGAVLGRHFGISGIVVGGLVLAAVTSLPPAVAAVTLAAKGRGSAALSTALTSNALNVTAGLLIPTVILGLGRRSGSELLIAGWYVGLTALTLGLAYAGKGLRRRAGWAIIAGYAAFVAALLVAS
jgi:cation:H+ antiporter